MPRPLAAVQTLMLRTARGPLAVVWGALFGLVLRAAGEWLRRAAPGSAAYAAGSFGEGTPLYGVSDLDLVVITPDDHGRARARVRARWERACQRVPLLPELIELAVHERSELERAASETAFTYGLGDGGAAYDGPDAIAEPRLLEGTAIYGVTSTWRPLTRGAPPPPVRAQGRHDARIAAWLQLQSWWRFASGACATPPGPRTAYLCVKFVSEPLRAWLWLARGERVVDREAALRRGLELLPEEEPAIRAALALHDRLGARPPAPLGEMLPHLVRLTERIAGLLHAEAESTTPVALEWREEDLGGMPLTDWRALTWGWPLDERLVPAAGDPGDPAAVAAAAAIAAPGLQPVLRHGSIAVLPIADINAGWGRLRAVQSAVTDPVSFALLDGAPAAHFPDAPGWSAEHWARRAVAEHRGWLAALPPDLDPPPLARSIAAARAALFLESVEHGQPSLPLTSAAALRALADRDEARRDVAEAAAEQFRAWRDHGTAPDAATARALLATVSELPAYARRAREPVAA